MQIVTIWYATEPLKSFESFWRNKICFSIWII